MSKNPQAALNYYESRLYNLELDKEDADRRIQTLRGALARYLQEGPRDGTIPGEKGAPKAGFDPSTPAFIPQFGASFLDRLLKMSTESNDQEFRQDLTERVVRLGMEKASFQKEVAYYQDMKNMLEKGLRTRGRIREGIESIESRFDNIVAEVTTTLELLHAIHDELSTNNLNPRTSLYTIKNSPRIALQRSISLTSLAIYGVVSVLAALFLTTLVCSIHGVLRGR